VSERDMADLIARVEKALGRSWSDIVEWLRDQNALPDLEDAIADGDTSGIVASVEEAAKRYAADIHASYVTAGQETASWLDKIVDNPVRFDVTNDRAAAWAKDNTADLVKGLSDESRATVKQVISDGVREGRNPRDIARDLRSSIGLTPSQADAVASYRKSLESGQYSDALGRQLSDGRDDKAIRAAQDKGVAIDPDRIDAMVERYRKNYVGYRAEVIARTESLRAVHAGNEELFQQAIDGGDIEADSLERQWNSAHDPRVRPSHRAMNGQKRKLGDNFVTGEGVELAYPGDPDGPIEETAQCRCVVSTRMVA
jgi:hypothetical protein